MLVAGSDPYWSGMTIPDRTSSSGCVPSESCCRLLDQNVSSKSSPPVPIAFAIFGFL